MPLLSVALSAFIKQSLLPAVSWEDHKEKNIRRPGASRGSLSTSIQTPEASVLGLITD